MNYANRDVEYSTLRAYLLNGATPICIHAHHASGVTSFVRKRMQDVCISLFGPNIFYIDASIKKNLSELLLTCLVQSEQLVDLQKFADKKWGEHANSILSSALEGIPYVGPVIGRLVERRTAVPLYTGVYSSAMEELLVHFFRKTEHRSLIVIDAVELLPESSFDLLINLLKDEVVQCLLIQTAESIQYDKLENRLFEEGINLSAQVNFDRPQVKLIKELGTLYDITISNDEALSIISKTKQNIHSIIKEIRSTKIRSSYSTMTSWEKATVIILGIWGGPLEESILYQIITMSEAFSFNQHETFKNTLGMLYEKGFIGNSSQGWVLKGRNDPLVQNIMGKLGEQLFYKNIVYEFLVHSKNGENHAGLRYQLSRELNCTTTTDAKAYLRQSIICGKEVQQDLMEAAHLVKGKSSDCLLAGIKYCRERKFEEAFMWVDTIPEEQITADIDAFRAALLNRIRRSEEAETALLRSLERNRHPAHQNLLSSFLISTYIHMDRLADAQAVYEERKNLFPNDPMHGYLVRNATSAFREYREDLYAQALSDFLSEQDEFGYYTTLCNQGNALCKTNDYQHALTILKEALNGLDVFPRSNLHIVYNDLGICYFLLGKYQNAYQCLLLAQRLGQNSMPRIFSIINLACVEAVLGHTEQALRRLKGIEHEVETHKLNRVRQKYYINCLLVKALHGNRDIGDQISKATAYPDRYFPEKSIYAIRVYKEFMNSNKANIQHNWRDLYSPCGLAYWYMDPLKLLPKGII